METIQDFLITQEKLHYFPNLGEKELRVLMLGYHNFRYIQTKAYPRQQVFHTLHFIISGYGYLIVNGKEFEVRPYDLFYLDNECTFCYYPNEKQPWEYCFFELAGNLCKTYAHAIGFSPENPVLPCLKSQEVLSQLHACLEEEPSYFSTLSLLMFLFDSVSTSKKYSPMRNIDLIQETKDFIDLYYNSPMLNLNFICETLHVSHPYLCRVFKAKENMTVIQYINQVKMQHAKELLTETSYTVYEIALQCGFNEYEYFLRLFKKMCGVTPTAFRKRN